MIITSPVYAALAPRQTNALSQLISEGIQVGDSILSELLSSTASAVLSTSTSPSMLTSASATTLLTSPSSTIPSSTPSPTSSSTSASVPSSTPLASSASSTSISATLAPLPAAATATGSSALSQSVGNHGTNKSLVIALSVVIGLLALALAVFTLWCCRRRSRRRRANETRHDMDVKRFPASDDDGLHATSDWQFVPLPLAQTKSIMRSPTVRSGHYEPLSPVVSETSPRNPFLAPAEAHVPSHHNSYTSQNSDGTLVPPMALVEGHSEVPAEVEGDTGALLEKHATPRSRAIWPSRTDSLKFDFGFGEKQAAGKRDGASFKVPRRPVAGYRR